MDVVKLDLSPTIIQGPADSMHERSAGLHLSEIYNHLDVQLNGPKSKSGPMPLSMLEVYRAGGFVWEHRFNIALADALAVPGEWERPGEVELNGVIGSPDLVNVLDWSLGETKFTWKSSRNFDELCDTGTGKLWVWLPQMMGYCHMLNMTKARLFAFFVNGDYRTMQPQFKSAEFTFTQRELTDNWSMLMAHARRLGWR